jgi:hypothetical protein
MAKCKVVSKPDYELTLSSEEKEALQKFLGKTGSEEAREAGLTPDQDRLLDGVNDVLRYS